MNDRALLAALYSGPLMIVGFIIGFVIFGGYYLPPGPMLSTVEVAQWYWQDPMAIRLAMVCCCIAMTLMAPYGVALAIYLRGEPGSRQWFAGSNLFYLQIILAALSSVAGIIPTLFWQLAAFRPEAVAPEIVQLLNDLGWYIFLGAWPSFSFWFLALAFAIFAQQKETNPRPIPRWVAFVSLWCAVLFIPAALIAFFKAGPFAWNGLLAFYVPVVIFFIWAAVSCVAPIRGMHRKISLNLQPGEAL